MSELSPHACRRGSSETASFRKCLRTHILLSRPLLVLVNAEPPRVKERRGQPQKCGGAGPLTGELTDVTVPPRPVTGDALRLSGSANGFL